MAPRFSFILPRDVPPEAAARRLGLSLEAFTVALPRLEARGFPRPDPDTRNFDLEAIERWCDRRHRHLFGNEPMGARDADSVVGDRLAQMRAGRG